MDSLEDMTLIIFAYRADSENIILEIEAEGVSAIVHTIVSTVHAHIVVFALEIDVHVGKPDTYALTHSYVIFHVSDAVVHNTPWLGTNVHPRRKRSQRS